MNYSEPEIFYVNVLCNIRSTTHAICEYDVHIEHIYINKYIFYNGQFKTIAVCKNCKGSRNNLA